MAYRKPRVIGISFDGWKTEKWPKDTITIAELKQKFNIPKEKMIMLKGGTAAKYFKNSGTIDLSKKGVTLAVQPDVTQGAFWKKSSANSSGLDGIDYRRNKKARYLISQLLEYGEEKYRRNKLTIQVTKDLKYIYIPDYPLPIIWRQRRVSILIHIPASYPDIPPLGFYIPHGTCLKNGRKHGHQYCTSYYDQPDLHDMGWDWFCLHLKNPSDWQPKDDPLKPDKLWNYLDIIRTGLSYTELGNVQ